MTVFSDTTPIIALSSIGRLSLLPELFGPIHLAGSVIDECAVGGRIAVPDLTSLDWVIPILGTPSDLRIFPLLYELDKGERDTLLWAMHMQAGQVLLDEKMGRNLAEYLGLNVTGTLGVLLKAKQMGLIETFRESAEAMRQQGIYFSDILIRRLANRIGE